MLKTITKAIPIFLKSNKCNLDSNFFLLLKAIFFDIYPKAKKYWHKSTIDG